MEYLSCLDESGSAEHFRGPVDILRYSANLSEAFLVCNLGFASLSYL